MIVTQEELELFKADYLITGRAGQLERERAREEIAYLTERVAELEKEFQAERLALREADSMLREAFIVQARG